jgi:toxin ParE1/3/4
MRGHYVLSPRAQTDIDEIWNYTQDQWGADQAETYIRLIQAAIEAVAADPRRGRPCDDIRPGYRKFAAGSHFVFYRVIAAGIDVVRILHQRMDFDLHL